MAGAGTVLAVVAALVWVVVTTRGPRHAAGAAAYAASVRGGWQAGWRAASQPAQASGPSQTGFADQTLRMTVRSTVGGRAVRVRISNAYGARPLRVGAVTIAEQSRGPVTGSQQAVTFAGRRARTVPAGAEAVSDAIAMSTRAGDQLSISVYLPAATGPATWHARGLVTTYLADGDRSSVPVGAPFRRMGVASWFFLDGIDVLDGAPRGGVVAFGDSITDGSTSTVDGYHTYPDWLADRLPGYAVLNAGIAGNRILTDTRAGGASALHRFRRDALDQPGVRVVVLLEGINDIGSEDASATRLIAAMRLLIDQAHARCVAIIGATITPFEGSGHYSATREKIRETVNGWIRTSGAFDAVVDFDASIRDSADPLTIDPRYHLPGNLHPNDLGYRVMAETAVPVLRQVRPACAS